MTATHQPPEQLVERHQDLVRSIAIGVRRKAPPHIELEDLIAYGQIGLVQASQDFDPTRGTRFSTYAYYRIRGAIYDGLSKLSWTSRARYNRLRYEQMANEVLSEDAQSASTAQSQAAASVGETADRQDTANLKQDARWLGSLTEKLAVVYLATCGEESGKSAAALPDPSLPPPPEQVAVRELCAKIHESVDALPDQAAELIRGVYFEGMTLQDAGKKLGISKSWASRLHAKTLRQLARSLILEDINE